MTTNIITRIGGYDTSGNANGVEVVGNYAYVADEDAGLQIIDISNPTNPTRIGGYDTSGDANGVQVVGNYAYVADRYSGLQIIDISNPTNPTRIGGYDTYGRALDVEVVGNYAYVADYDGGLQIIDISNPANPTRTGGYDTSSNQARGVEVVGNYAYVADSRLGLQIIDISNPANPTRTGGYREDGSDARDVAVVGNYAYVAFEYGGLQIIDISNPANPTRTGGYNPSVSYRRVEVVGNYAYVAARFGGLQIIDISNPTNPTRTGAYDTSGIANNVQVVGNYAYVADDFAGLQIIDVSGFTQSPTQQPSIGIVATTNAVQPEGNSGTTPFTFTVTRTGNTTGTSTVNWAVTGTGTNPANAADFAGGTLPTGTVTFAPGVTSQVITVNVSGDTVVELDETFTVSLSNPSNATISTATTTGTIRNDDTVDNTAPVITPNQSFSYREKQVAGYQVGTVAATDNLAVTGYSIISGNPDGFFSINNSGVITLTAAGVAAAANDFETAPNSFTLGITARDAAGNTSTATNVTTYILNQMEVTLVGNYDTSRIAVDVQVVGNYAYVADWDAGLQIIDISDPANPTRMAGYDTSGYAWGVEVVGNYAYVADSGSGLQIIDISDPANPTLTGGYDTSGSAVGVEVVGNYAYVADDDGGLQIIDISNPANPTRTGGYDTSGIAMGVQVVGNYGYVTDGYALQIIDISDPANPTLTGGYNTSGSARDVQVVGNYAYVADWHAGLQIIDISNPANPTRTGGYDTSGIAWDVQVVGNYAYVADADAGLQIIDISDPANPTLTGGYDTSGSAMGVQVVGNYAYVTDGYALQIIDVSEFTQSPTEQPSIGIVPPINAVQTEGNTGTTPFTFTVTRTGDTTGISTVNWAVTDTLTDNQVNHLPDSVKNAVVQAVSQRLELPLSQINIVEALPQTWVDGCLNLAAAGEVCTLALVPGWRVRVDAGDQSLIYHTDNTGLAVRFNEQGDNPATSDDFAGGVFPSGTLTFAAGVTSQVITVNVSGDTEVELDETFTVTLSNPSNAIITTAATGTIRNDDTPPVVSDRQQITSLDNLTAAPGGNVSIPLLYNTSTGDNTVTGISLRLHYNSNQLNFQTVENLFNNNLFVTVEDLADSRNLDNDPQSDRYIQFGYTDFAGNWPNQTLPLKLGDFNFTTTGNFTGTQLNLTSDNLAPNYSLEADPILVSKQEWNFDIDGNGEVKALSDGIMIVRHLFGTFPGERLTEGAMASNATRNLAEIQAYLQQGVDNKYLDIDGNGEIKALSDGIMIVRHLFGTFPDERLIEGAITSNATRDLTQIQAHLTQFSTVV
jgi:hypothetical protein